MVGERIIHELRGVACLPLELMPAQRKGCAVTRSFSSRTWSTKFEMRSPRYTTQVDGLPTALAG